jgi:hypothetical protein
MQLHTLQYESGLFGGVTSLAFLFSAALVRTQLTRYNMQLHTLQYEPALFEGVTSLVAAVVANSRHRGVGAAHTSDEAWCAESMEGAYFPLEAVAAAPPCEQQLDVL